METDLFIELVSMPHKKILTDMKQASQKTLKHLEEVFGRLSLWRASSWLIEDVHVFVTSWNMSQKMNQVGNITTMDAQTLKVEPWDKKVLADIEKAIYDANLWLTPQNQGDYIMIKIPPLTTERRKELAKVVSREWEEAKVWVRNHRHDARKKVDTMLAEETISKNEKENAYQEIDAIAKEYNDMIDSHVKAKSEEVMKV